MSSTDNFSDIIKSVKTPIGLLALVILVGGMGIGVTAITLIKGPEYKLAGVAFCLIFLLAAILIYGRYVQPAQIANPTIEPFRILMGSLAREIYDALADYLASEGPESAAESWAVLLCSIATRGDGENQDVANIRASLANQLYQHLALKSPTLKQEVDSWVDSAGISFPINVQAEAVLEPIDVP